jgi:sulfate permease, SulP family
MSVVAVNYSWTKGRSDLVAGLTVAAVALPQGIAYALIAGVDPKYGVYSAIVVTAIASIFGSSSHLINGPTSAISLLVFSSLAFIISESVIIGFMFAAAFLLAIGQIGNALGVKDKGNGNMAICRCRTGCTSPCFTATRSTTGRCCSA